MKKNGILAGTGVLTAISASLCCITPVLALISGSSGLASSFSWLEPARPYLLGTTIAVLAFAWYQKLKPAPADDCGCAVDEKQPFMQSKSFLGMVTAFALLMMAFPYYSNVFYSNSQDLSQNTMLQNDNIVKVEFEIEGMTCSGCEQHVTTALDKVDGVQASKVSYENANAIIKFDTTKTNTEKLKAAIDGTGYKTIAIKE